MRKSWCWATNLKTNTNPNRYIGEKTLRTKAPKTGRAALTEGSATRCPSPERRRNGRCLESGFLDGGQLPPSATRLTLAGAHLCRSDADEVRSYSRYPPRGGIATREASSIL